MSRWTIRLLLPLLLLAAVLDASVTGAQDVNRAALVVRFDDAQVAAQCIEFSEPQISGLELLLRSDLQTELEAQGLGALVCRIENSGCPADDCLCQCRGGGNCVYWSYWNRIEGAWLYSAIGASQRFVENGSVEGWSWGPGSLTDAIPPPDVGFDDVCLSGLAVEPSATPTVSPSPTLILLTVLPSPTLRATSTPGLIVTAPSPTMTERPAGQPVVSTASATSVPTMTPAVTALPSRTPTPVERATSILEPLPAPATAQPVSEAQEPSATPQPVVAGDTGAVRQRPTRANAIIQPVTVSSMLGEATEVAAVPRVQLTVIGADFDDPGLTSIEAPGAVETSSTQSTNLASYAGFALIAGVLAFLALLATKRRG